MLPLYLLHACKHLIRLKYQDFTKSSTKHCRLRVGCSTHGAGTNYHTSWGPTCLETLNCCVMYVQLSCRICNKHLWQTIPLFCVQKKSVCAFGLPLLQLSAEIGFRWPYSSFVKGPLSWGPRFWLRQVQLLHSVHHHQPAGSTVQLPWCPQQWVKCRATSQFGQKTGYGTDRLSLAVYRPAMWTWFSVWTRSSFFELELETCRRNQGEQNSICSNAFGPYNTMPVCDMLARFTEILQSNSTSKGAFVPLGTHKKCLLSWPK